MERTDAPGKRQPAGGKLRNGRLRHWLHPAPASIQMSRASSLPLPSRSMET